MGLQNKIFIYAAISLLALMSLLTWISGQTNSQAIQMVQQERIAIAENVASEVNDLLFGEPEIANDARSVRDAVGSLFKHLKGGFNLELISSNGVVIANSANISIQSYSTHWSSVQGLSLAQRPGIVEERINDGQHHIIAYAPLSQFGWGIILEKPGEETLILPWMGGRPLLVIGLILLLAGGLMGLVTRQIVVPLKRLAATSKKFGAGDLEADIPVTGNDEIGELAGDLDTMRKQLKHSLDEIVELNRDLEQRVKQRTHELEELEKQLREQNKERGELLGKIITTQEEERKRIARELHDEVGQSITSLMIGFRVLETQDPEKMRQGIERLKQLSAHTLEEVRHLALELRPSSLDDLGLIAALRQYIREYTDKFSIPAEFQANGFEGKRLKPEVEIALYRIIQEALTNVAKHAQAKKVSVLMGVRNSTIIAIIEDNGKGFDVKDIIDSSAREHRLGIYGMQERASLIGGTITIEANAEKGTSIFVEVPLEGDDGK